jgi:hypothetical protein
VSALLVAAVAAVAPVASPAGDPEAPGAVPCRSSPSRVDARCNYETRMSNCEPMPDWDDGNLCQEKSQVVKEIQRVLCNGAVFYARKTRDLVEGRSNLCCDGSKPSFLRL